MTNRPLHILLVEDNPGDARLIVEDLREPDVKHEVVQSGRLDEAVRHLHGDSGGSVDVVILDLSLPDAKGLEAIERLRVVAPRLPIVVLTGLDDESFAFRAVEEGVQDYLVKGKVNGSVIVRALRYAIERKRAEEAAHRAEEASRAATLRETIMGIIGHDLHVPLQSIASSAELLVRAHDLAPQHAGAARRIAEGSARMTSMIDNLLDFAQARLGEGYVLAVSDCDLEEICRQAILALSAAHPAQGIQFTTKGSGKGCWDRGRIAQVAMELARNAVRHARGGSAIKLSIHEEEADVVLSVHNDGAPIPADARSRLFEPFFRSETRDDAARGLGLGLYIVQQIVIAHRGTIDVHSGDGEGTTFRVRLPRG